jgi:hypothetical protein
LTTFHLEKIVDAQAALHSTGKQGSCKDPQFFGVLSLKNLNSSWFHRVLG